MIEYSFEINDIEPLEGESGYKKREFMDRIQHGDDFFKIEMWRPARNWYKRALELNINTEHVYQKIAECDRLIAYEVKIFRILLFIAATIIFMVSILF